MRLSSIAFAGLMLLASCSSPEPTVTIRGTVAAADGSALQGAWITVCDRVDGSARSRCYEHGLVLQTKLASGSFELPVPAGTILQVVASAPGFQPEKARLITGEPGSSQQVAFELGGLEYHETPDWISLLYWPDGISNRGVMEPMVRDDSGAWTATIAPLEKETLYRFNGAVVRDRGSITGSGVVDRERPHRASPWGYLVSVAPPSRDSARFRYVHQFRDHSEGGVLLEAASHDSELWGAAEEQFRAYRDAFADGGPEGVSAWERYANGYDWSHAEALRDSLLDTPPGLAREVIALSYLAIIPNHRDATTRLIMDTVSPASPAWDWTGRLAPALLIAGTEDILAVHDYLGQAFDQMSNDSLAAEMMHYAALTLAGKFESAARAEGNWDAFADSLAMAMYLDLVQKYPDARATKAAAKSLDPDRATKIGNPVPAFELASMDEPDRVISRESLLGMTYLVDFWGTWCAPCIREMPYMHATYEKYKDHGFTIVSFAWDHREGVDAFRKEWPMPWEHLLLEGYPTPPNPVTQAFNVRGYPRYLLISAEGIIIEEGFDNLRHPALDSTLAVHLGLP